MYKHRHKIPIKLSHKMINDVGRTDAGKQSQENSFSPCVRTFFSMEEGPGTAVISDIVGGATMDNTGVMTIEDGFDTSLVQRLSMLSSKVLTSGDFPDAGDRDVVIISCARARIDATHVDDYYGGCFSFYVGNQSYSGGGQLKVQPTQTIFGASSSAGDLPDGVATPYQPELAKRVDGQDYIIAGVKRGRTIEHWSDGVKTGEITAIPERHAPGLLERMDSWTPTPSMFTAHSPVAKDIAICRDGEIAVFPISGETCNKSGLPAFGAGGYIRPNGDVEIPSLFWPPLDGNTEVIAEYPQDQYGFLICVFEDGAPADVGEAMMWMKEQWIQGNKVIWPSWSTLK